LKTISQKREAMKKLTMVLLSVMIIFAAGCGYVTTMTKNTPKTGIFTAVKEESPIPIGFTDVLIKASIKIHEEGFYWFEPKNSMHGKPGYPFVLNIDGQVVTWKVDGRKEDTPRFDEDGNTNVEAGVGIKYTLEKKIRLAGGMHKLVLTLPGEELSTSMDIAFKPGRSHVLEFKPFYKHHKRHATTFLCTIAGYDVFLDGKRMVVYNRKS
jgi:hypothetical protein